jgi:hypothetical protein
VFWNFKTEAGILITDIVVELENKLAGFLQHYIQYVSEQRNIFDENFRQPLASLQDKISSRDVNMECSSLVPSKMEVDLRNKADLERIDYLVKSLLITFVWKSLFQLGTYYLAFARSLMMHVLLYSEICLQSLQKERLKEAESLKDSKLAKLQARKQVMVALV